MASRLLKAAVPAIAFSWLISPSGVTSQEKAPEQSPAKGQAQYQLSVGTNMVLVPAVVTDRRGQHVSGLTVADFELLEDGKIQKISGFEEVVAETTTVQRPPIAPNAFTNQVIAEHPKRLEIILLDLLNTPLSGRAEARRGLIQFLSRSTEANALMALLVLRSDGVSMIHNFTSDPAVLTAAISRAQAPVASRDTPTLNTDGGDADAEARQLKAIAAGQAAITSMSNHPTVAAANAEMRGEEALLDLSQENREAYLTQQCLQQIARYFAGVPGRKSLIWASTGFKLMAPVSGVPASTPPDFWRRAIQMLQDANIAVYPIDVGGLSLGGEGDVAVHGEIPSLAPGNDAMRPGGIDDVSRVKHEVMDKLAAQTGGRAYYNRNDSGELFGRASQDSAHYYILAYYTKDAGKDGWRNLHVRALRGGAQVRARSGFGFFFSNSAVRNSETARRVDEMMAITSALESTSLGFSGQWKEIEPAGDQRKVHFVLTIPAAAVLVDTEHQNHVSLDFLVLVWNSDGKEAAQIGQRMDTKLSPEELMQTRTKGIDYTNVLSLPPGQYEVHFAVRDNLRGKLGSVVTRLKLD